MNCFSERWKSEWDSDPRSREVKNGAIYDARVHGSPESYVVQGGEGGIRTHEGDFLPLNRLASGRLRPARPPLLEVTQFKINN